MRIAIVRTSALGDVVQALPVLNALRREHRDAQIAWVIEARFAPLLEDHPDLDELIRVDTKGWRKDRSRSRGIKQARRALRRFAPDIALDLMSNWKAAALARLSGARVVAGLKRSERREPASAILLKQRVAPLGEHAVLRAYSTLAVLGLETSEIDFAGDRLAPKAKCPEFVVPPEIVLHPGAGWRNKEYPAPSWAAVCKTLYEQTGRETLVVTGPGEEALGQSIEELAKGSARTQLVPDLQDLVALQRRARVVLGGDTGPIHLAHALGRPVICVMGPTDPKRHGPFEDPDAVLSKRLPCSYCHKRLDSAKGCLLQISPESVAKRVIERLDR